MNNTIEHQVGVGYVRVSQERAAKNGYGLKEQEADIEKHAKYRGIRLFHTYKESQSGYDRDRPQLDKMIEDAKAGRFHVVIFPSIDRAGRSVKDIIDIESVLRRHDIDIVFVREGIDTSTPVGELFRNIMASIAQFEGRLIYDRLYKGKRRKALEGGYTGGWLPYGYRLKDNAVVVVKEEAVVVGNIFTWRAEGKPLKWICDELKRKGIKTKRGARWHVSTIQGILGNRFYTGRIEFEGAFIRAQHDAIISDILFQKCQEI